MENRALITDMNNLVEKAINVIFKKDTLGGIFGTKTIQITIKGHGDTPDDVSDYVYTGKNGESDRDGDLKELTLILNKT